MTQYIRYIFCAFCLATVVFTLTLSSSLAESASKIFRNQPIKNNSTDTRCVETHCNASLQIAYNPPIESPRVTLMVVGDMMLDRSVYLHTKKANDYTWPFQKISSFHRRAAYRHTLFEDGFLPWA